MQWCPKIVIIRYDYAHLWSGHCEGHHCSIPGYGKQTHIVLQGL